MCFFMNESKSRDSPSGCCQLSGNTRFQKRTRYPEKVESTRKNGPVPNTPPTPPHTHTPFRTLPAQYYIVIITRIHTSQNTATNISRTTLHTIFIFLVKSLYERVKMLQLLNVLHALVTRLANLNYSSQYLRAGRAFERTLQPDLERPSTLVLI